MLELHPPPTGLNLERAETIDVLVTLLSEDVSIEPTQIRPDDRCAGAALGSIAATPTSSPEMTATWRPPPVTPIRGSVFSRQPVVWRRGRADTT
ncbi:MAG TPA: hypothetical protein VGV93_09420, partial [Acidimicrobiales bacterium]|nr:hypothetical protein [Acidimicrobiales bacterium]